MVKVYQFILTIYSSIIVISAFTDPSVLNPQLTKRFEYKLSFKGPHLAFKDGTVPFWAFGGSAIASDDQVRVTPSIRSQKGWIWSKNAMTADNWLLDVKLRVTGRGRVGADGMAIWFTEQAGVEGPVFGSNDQWKGLGVFLDSFDNDALQNNPIISVMINDGTKIYDHQHDGSGQIQGSCIRDFRNKPFPIRLIIEYINQGLTVYINNGISQDDTAFEFCTRIDGIQLPKTGYLGVSAATGGLADDHDVIEFLTNTYSDKKAAAQNQAATDEQAKKYKEEYEKYEQELKKQQADYQKDHPDLTTPMNEQALYESEYDREFRTILEGQDQIRVSLTNIDRKMAELLGRVERLGTNTGGQQQIIGQAGSGVPADVARIQDINRVINANTDMTRTIQSFAQVLTDLQQKVNNLQGNLNNQRPGSGGQQVVAPNLDGTILNEVRESVRLIKLDTNNIIHKSPQEIKCPTVSGSSCVGTLTFICAMGLQIVILIGYFTFKNRQDRINRKYL
jgi:mannose-binding lectin 1